MSGPRLDHPEVLGLVVLGLSVLLVIALVVMWVSM